MDNEEIKLVKGAIKKWSRKWKQTGAIEDGRQMRIWLTIAAYTMPKEINCGRL